MVLSGCAFRSQVAHSSSLLNELKFSECYLHKCCKLSRRCFTFLDNFCKFGPKLQGFDILSFFRIYTLKAKRAAYVYRKGCPPFLHKRYTRLYDINRVFRECLSIDILFRVLKIDQAIPAKRKRHSLKLVLSMPVSLPPKQLFPKTGHIVSKHLSETGPHESSQRAVES